MESGDEPIIVFPPSERRTVAAAVESSRYGSSSARCDVPVLLLDLHVHVDLLVVSGCTRRTGEGPTRFTNDDDCDEHGGAKEDTNAADSRTNSASEKSKAHETLRRFVFILFQCTSTWLRVLSLSSSLV